MTRIRRTIAAAVSGILLSLGSVAVATPAHADNEVAKLECTIQHLAYGVTQLLPDCRDAE
ncbi:hypothetical protein [Streptomyces abikoensis]